MSKANAALRFTAFLTLSVCAHVAGVTVLMHTDSEPNPAGAASPPLDQPDQTVLGIERSTNATINWIGYETPTEQNATPAENDQAAFAIVPGSPEQVGETQDEQDPLPAATPEQAPAEEPVEQAEPIESVVDLSGFVPVLPLADTPPDSSVVIEPPEPAETETAVQQPAPPAEAASTARGAPDPAGTPQEDLPPQDAAPSDQESEATSREPELDVKLGRPAAADGLTIKTIRPRWSNTVLLTARPRNPVVRIEFRRDGTVRKATFLAQGKVPPGTGHSGVDGPLLDAIYRWTASGDRLLALPESGDASLGITMRISLTGR